MPEKTITREDLAKEFEDHYQEIVPNYFRPAADAEHSFWLGQRFGVAYFSANNDRSLAELLDALAVKFGEIVFEDREELEALRDRNINDEGNEIAHLEKKLAEKDAEIEKLTGRVAFLENALRVRDPLEPDVAVEAPPTKVRKARVKKLLVTGSDQNGAAVIAVVAVTPPPPAYFPPPPPPPPFVP